MLPLESVLDSEELLAEGLGVDGIIDATGMTDTAVGGPADEVCEEGLAVDAKVTGEIVRLSTITTLSEEMMYVDGGPVLYTIELDGFPAIALLAETIAPFPVLVDRALFGSGAAETGFVDASLFADAGALAGPDDAATLADAATFADAATLTEASTLTDAATLADAPAFAETALVVL